MDDSETEETRQEVEQELAELGSSEGDSRLPGRDNVGYEGDQPVVVEMDPARAPAPAPKEGWLDGVIDQSCRENSWFGKKCLKIFKVRKLIVLLPSTGVDGMTACTDNCSQLFVNCFSMTFIAEWGDRSQLATIVLAGLNDVWGVILGGCLGKNPSCS